MFIKYSFRDSADCGIQKSNARMLMGSNGRAIGQSGEDIETEGRRVDRPSRDDRIRGPAMPRR